MTTNRTKVELKRVCKARRRRNGPDYQSYQSGIETRDTHPGVVPSVATNRTKVELKLNTNLLSSLWNITYQSYQSGIETNHRQQWKLRVDRLPIVPKWN